VDDLKAAIDLAMPSAIRRPQSGCGILVSMFAFRIRGRRWWLGAIATALVASVAVPLLRSTLEHAVRARIESAAVRHGAIARIGLVHIGVWPFLRLEGFDLDLGHGLRVHADMIAATWPGRLRLAVRAAALAGPAGVRVSAPATAWDTAGIFGDELRLALVEPQAGLSIHKLADPVGGAWNIEVRGLDVGRLLDVRRDARPLLDGGIEDGRVDFQFSTDALRFRVDMGARGARLGALADHADDELQLGDPTDLTIRFDGTWRRAGGVVEIPEVHATLAGAALSGSIALRNLDTDPVVDLALGVQHLDFAQLLGASGLGVPESLGMAPGGGGLDLGSASIDVRVRGRPADPASLSVSQKIDFKPPRQMPPAILRLRGEFVFRSQDGSGPHRPVDVSPASPDFIALRDAPPLFVRTLLLSEDAGFYGHRGIDLRELPAALLTNWSRGGAARGASTITQQLAKNLFLSRDKQLGRKLQELAITFLLESALGKDRILEIYLNIIEWGPDLRGLRPAARSYFGREPQALTPAEMAFLVAIIPGPIKYQSSFAHGTPGPGLRSLIDALLAKLRAVDAIGEEEYRQALDEPIVVAGGRPRG
jgi:Transglycosylase